MNRYPWKAGGLAVAGLVAVLAVHGSLFWISHHPAPRKAFGDEHRYLYTARDLAAGVASPPHPMWPTLYPRFLAGLLAAGGGPLALEVVQTLMLLAVAWILADLSRRLSGSPVAGAVAGGLVLVYPPLVAFAHYRWPEVLHLLLFVSALSLLARHGERPERLCAAGLLLGLAVQTKHLLAPFLPVLLLPLALEGPPRRRLLRPGLVILAIGLALAPAAVRDRGIPLADRLLSSPSFNLWVGLNDRSRRGFVDPVVGSELERYERSADSFGERNRILWQKIRRLVGERGGSEVASAQLGRQYFRLFDRESFLTVQLPADATGQVIKRGYVDPDPAIARGLRGASHALYTTILIGAALGIAVCRHRGRPWLLVGLAFLAYNLVILFFFHVKSRYRIQLLPFLFYYTGCSVAWGAQRLGLAARAGDFARPEMGRGAWLAAALGAALLVFLAWGGPWLDGRP